jgi:hypothetical protein
MIRKHRAITKIHKKKNGEREDTSKPAFLNLLNKVILSIPTGCKNPKSCGHTTSTFLASNNWHQMESKRTYLMGKSYVNWRHWKKPPKAI